MWLHEKTEGGRVLKFTEIHECLTYVKHPWDKSDKNVGFVKASKPMKITIGRIWSKNENKKRSGCKSRYEPVSSRFTFFIYWFQLDFHFKIIDLKWKKKTEFNRHCNQFETLSGKWLDYWLLIMKNKTNHNCQYLKI